MLYKDLIVWQKSHALTLKTINAVKKVNRSYTTTIIINQLLRAVMSVGANIAEGYGRHQGKEYLHFLEYAYGSANEVDNWLIVLRDAGLMQSETTEALIKDNEEVLKILTTMIKKLKGDGRG
jgi:four helix bundle protein